MNAPQFRTFLEFLHEIREEGCMPTDDLLGSMLPLLREVQEVHETGFVSPLEGVEHVHVQGSKLWFEEARKIEAQRADMQIRALQRELSDTGVRVVADLRDDRDADTGEADGRVAKVADPDDELTRPMYLTRYVCWEQTAGHHDQLTDIFSAGMIMASLGFGLDFTEEKDVRQFATYRGNLFLLNPDLHPVVVSVILSMTELDRHRRAQDLQSVISCLENYRDQPANRYQPDFTQLKGFREATVSGRQDMILTHLRDRLFEISRRNRVLYFRQTMQTLNLTESSVPVLLDYKNIKAEQLFYWHQELADKVVAGKTLNLGKYLNFQDLPFISGILDRVRRDANRHKTEFGFAQLRLVIAFLRWHDLKEAPEERIHSPLLLLPVELTKKKGVRDTYLLEPLSTEAEVNPVLRHHLKQLYDLNLPEAIDLAETTPYEFHKYLSEQIHASERGVNLNLIDRPQIELIYASARHQLNSYQRRKRLSGRGVRKYEDGIDYCYNRDHFHPLGLQLFLRKIRPSSSPFDDVLKEKPTIRYPFMSETKGMRPQSSTIMVRRRTLYSLKRGSEANPYVWDFDLCGLTLGNFNYRKMSLVQDYATILEDQTEDRAFNEIFSSDPRDLPESFIEPMDPDNLNLIVPADPTQASAVTRAREGPSYIIQGPPGTGKSQTITNLIADYVARGKRILFVCEKRAAIDVVFHRLQQQGLDVLSCLIHDSQTDKKEFIQELKKTYELFINDEDGGSALIAERKSLLKTIRDELEIVRMLSTTMTHTFDDSGVELRNLIHRLVQLRDQIPEMSPTEVEKLPTYDCWVEFGDIVNRLSEAFVEIKKSPVLAEHAVRLLSRQAVNHEEPMAYLDRHIEAASDLLDDLSEALDESELDTEKWDDLDDLKKLVGYTEMMTPFAKQRLIQLLNEKSDDARDFERLLAYHRTAMKSLDSARERTTNWKEKLPERDTETALALAKQLEGSFLSIFKPAWWRLRGVLNRHFDFSRCVVKPTWVQILTELQHEHKEEVKTEEALQAIKDRFQIQDLAEVQEMLRDAGERLAKFPPSVVAYHRETLDDDDPPARVDGLQHLAETSRRLEAEMEEFLVDYSGLALSELEDAFADLRNALTYLPEVLPFLTELHTTPEPLQEALRHMPVTPDQIEAAMGDKSYRHARREARFLSRFDSRALQRRLERLGKAYNKLLDINAQVIVNSIRERFQDKLRICDLPASQLTPDQKEFKKEYNAGRREIEHEFGKVMRFKSIRDLGTGASGTVIRDLKPIWLMSPLSVADTLPLVSDYFDVVIFDEASQVKMEEAIPAIFRATQAIVVGDEMQLPPTNFFTAQRSNEDDTVVVEDDNGEDIEFDLNFESLLSQSARNLPSIMLGWHFRSRYEALIGFSNANFYQNQLLTIPDHQLSPEDLEEIMVEDPATGGDNVNELLRRSISLHRMPGSVYEKRRNPGEANYIAHLVRGLLQDGSRKTIGIVAFSEAQQDEIENALNRLAGEDDDFRNLLEAEMEREDDDQFVGLFVKNLENVQGDERDIIILSICYAFDRQGKMRMNFGPINKTGGEKRLNVIFSRSKRHMAVVSSIQHMDITNDYNDGARCLKNFLEYAAAISKGDEKTAARVLRGVHGQGVDEDDTAENAIVAEIESELEQRGYAVTRNCGKSKFRCTLAVRKPDETDFRLGILVDTAGHYATSDILERYLIQPVVLRVFGWKIVFILSDDWLQRRDDVMRRLERVLETGEDDEEEPEEQEEEIVVPDFVEEEPDDEGDPEEPPNAFEEEEDESPEIFRRYVELRRGSSYKFWEVTVYGCTYTVRYGRIGTGGQVRTKEFATPERARYEGERMLKTKLNKGYRSP